MSPSSDYPICSPPQRVLISYCTVNTVSVTNTDHLMMLIETIAVWPFTEWLDDRSEDIYRGTQKGGSIFLGVTVSVIVRKKKVHRNVCLILNGYSDVAL